jgi:hypothetical protein
MRFESFRRGLRLRHMRQHAAHAEASMRLCADVHFAIVCKTLIRRVFEYIGKGMEARERPRRGRSEPRGARPASKASGRSSWKPTTPGPSRQTCSPAR